MSDTASAEMPNTVIVGSSVGGHWVHQKFAKNLLAASNTRVLSEAAREWHLEEIGCADSGEDSLNCNLCNQRIRNFVHLYDRVNGNRLIVGEDCYKKLLHYLKSAKVESALPTYDEYSSGLRAHWKGLLKELHDRTVVGWLKDELAGKRLPKEVASIVYTISKLGFAPTTGEADAVVAYYKATRLFPIEVFFEEFTLASFRHQAFLPRMITIDQINRIKGVVLKDKELLVARWGQEEAEQQAKREAEALKNAQWLDKCREEQRVENERNARLNWESYRHRVLETDLRDLYRKMEEAGAVSEVSMALSRATLEDTLTRISNLIPTGDTGLDPDVARQATRQARAMADEWMSVNRWKLVEAEVVVLVGKSSLRPYFLVKRNGTWQSRRNIDRYLSPGVVPETGLYVARVIDKGVMTEILLHKQIDSQGLIVEVDFSEESETQFGTYVGYHNGKVVLPNEKIIDPGKYTIFLMNNEGRYYRGWVM